VKIITLKAKKHCMLAGLLALLMVGYVAVYPSAARAAAKDRSLPIYSVDRDQKVCSISFDAAWGNALLRRRQLSGLRPSYPSEASFCGSGGQFLPPAVNI